MTRTTNTYKGRIAAAIFSAAFALLSYTSYAGCATQVSVTQQPGLVCSGSPVALTATTDGSGGYFAWEANSSNTGSANYIAPAVSTRMMVQYIVPTLNCHRIDTFTIHVSPAPDANAGNNGIITSGPSTVTIGGKPTGQAGTGRLSYLWSTGDTVPNPIVTITGASSYTVTVTDANNCSAASSVSFSYGGYLELMSGRDLNSTGRVVSDMVVDNGGMLYACGWADKDIFIHNNLQQHALISSGDHSAFFFVAKYDPNSVYPYQWGTKVGAFVTTDFNTHVPTYCTGLAAHPFTPNIVESRGDVFVSYNQQHANICRINKANGSIIYNEVVEGFIISDMKEDLNGNLCVTGYCSSPSGAMLGGVRFALGEIFAANLNMYTNTTTWMWVTNTSLNALGADGIPSLAPMPTSTGAILLSTGNQLNFLKSVSGILISSNSTTVGGSNINTRTAVDVDPNSPYVYVTDGNKIFQFIYSSAMLTTSRGSVRADHGPIYDLKIDGGSNIIAITYSDVEKFDASMSGNLWATTTTNPYNSCGANTLPYFYDMSGGADRCLALNPLTNQIYAGGSHPDQSCPFSGSYAFNTKFGFIAEIDHTTGGFSQKTSTLIIDTKPVTGFNIYPNPVQNQLNISSGTAEGGDYILRNLAGQEILAGELSAQSLTTISTTGLPAGVYLVQVRSAGRVQTEKIIKE